MLSDFVLHCTYITAWTDPVKQPNECTKLLLALYIFYVICFVVSNDGMEDDADTSIPLQQQQQQSDVVNNKLNITVY